MSGKIKKSLKGSLLFELSMDAYGEHRALFPLLFSNNFGNYFVNRIVDMDSKRFSYLLRVQTNSISLLPVSVPFRLWGCIQFLLDQRTSSIHAPGASLCSAYLACGRLGWQISLTACISGNIPKCISNTKINPTSLFKCPIELKYFLKVHGVMAVYFVKQI